MSFNIKTPLQSYCPVFLETGTYHGEGVRRALNAGFSKVISIELFEPLYQENLLRFSNEIEKGLVKLVLGDSGTVIGEAIKLIDEPILFWFDAHDQSMEDGGVGDCKCPLIQELNNIMAVRELSKRRLDVLLIDDMRLITNKGVGWNVDLTEMYQLIWEYNPDFRLTRESGHIAHDILRCENKYLV